MPRRPFLVLRDLLWKTARPVLWSFEIKVAVSVALERKRPGMQLKALGEQNPAVARYYKSRGLYLGATSSGRIDADPLDETEARGDVTVPPVRLAWWTLRIRLTTLRETLTGRIEEWLPPEEAGVLEGMLVGDKTDIGPDTNTAFQRAGVLHLFAVSGFHVSLWTMLVYKILLHLQQPICHA